MKRIITGFVFLLTIIHIFAGCSSVKLTEDSIYENHLRAMERHVTTDASHYRNVLFYEFGDGSDDEFIQTVWTHGKSMYAENVSDDGSATPATLVYEGSMYSFSSVNDWYFIQKIEAESWPANPKFDNTAKLIAWEENENGFSVTTEAPWLAETEMGYWLCQSPKITYFYDKSWILQSIEIVTDLYPNPNYAELLEGTKSGVCKQTCTFYKTPIDEIEQKIVKVWKVVNSKK